MNVFKPGLITESCKIQMICSAGFCIAPGFAWSWIFLGAGVYGLLMSIVRLVSENFSNPTTWDWVWSVIFFIIGTAGFVAIDIPWWLILILIGVVILGNALFRRD